MQKDMHYCAVYALARAAGLKTDAAAIIASASLFVDDSGESGTIANSEGLTIKKTVTAHHTTSTKNLNRKDQRRVWVPFHFLPGISGTSFEEKITCVKDSDIAQTMLTHLLESECDETILYRMGICAHVYFDTFSHFGFSGISSKRNKVVNHSIDIEIEDPDQRKIILEHIKAFKTQYNEHGTFIQKLGELLTRITGAAAEFFSSALGHGPVATCPDKPFLRWKFSYEKGNRSESRNNTDHFVDACEKMHALLRSFALRYPNFCTETVKDFSLLRPGVSAILSQLADKEERCRLWHDAVRSGMFTGNAEEIPHYRGAQWNCAETVNDEAFLFHKAAAAHREYVLTSLLPSRGLSVI